MCILPLSNIPLPHYILVEIECGKGWGNISYIQHLLHKERQLVDSVPNSNGRDCVSFRVKSNTQSRFRKSGPTKHHRFTCIYFLSRSYFFFFLGYKKIDSHCRYQSSGKWPKAKGSITREVLRKLCKWDRNPKPLVTGGKIINEQSNVCYWAL